MECNNVIQWITMWVDSGMADCRWRIDVSVSSVQSCVDKPQTAQDRNYFFRLDVSVYIVQHIPLDGRGTNGLWLMFVGSPMKPKGIIHLHEIGGLNLFISLVKTSSPESNFLHVKQSSLECDTRRQEMSTNQRWKDQSMYWLADGWHLRSLII